MPFVVKSADFASCLSSHKFAFLIRYNDKIKTLQILLQDIEKNATIKTKIHFQKVQNTNVYQRNSKV